MRTRDLALCAALLVGAVGQSAGRAQGQVPQPVFRSNTDLVTVPVFVKGGSGTVSGLGAGDFVLTDNGVAQHVESLDGESLPVDVTILLETSHALEDYRQSLNEQVSKIAALVRANDRIEVLGIDDYVSVLVPFGPPTRALGVGRFTGGGMTSVNDAMVAALLRQPDPDRRHLIVAMTDSIDTMSTLDVAAVRDVASTSTATLVVCWITLSEDAAFNAPANVAPPWMTSAEKLDRHVKSASQRTVPPRQQWTPHYDPPRGRDIYAFDVLRDATEMTGGALHPPGVFTDRNAAVIFDRIYAEFRHNYVLRYLPQGVAHDGWHDVSVSIPRQPDLELRARRGYLVEPESASTPPAAIAAPPPGSLNALIAAAGEDNIDGIRATIAHAAADDTLAALIRGFRAAGNVWPATPRREFVTALALADAGLMSASVESTRASLDLLTHAERMVRPPTGPDAFEREWIGATAAILEGAMRPLDALPLVTAAVNGLPGDPHPLLARAIIADQLTVLPPEGGGRELASQAMDQLLGFYDLAINQDVIAVATEARIRKGWLLRRLGRESDARALFEAARPSAAPDATMRAWLNLVEHQTLSPSPSVDDPVWATYWSGDHRLFNDLLERLSGYAREQRHE
jgi:VWFA-related protein